MPLEVVYQLRASGGNYTSMSAFEAAREGDLVVADEVRVIECYNDWAGGLSDTVDFSGSTTDATRHFIIRPAPGSGTQGPNRHDGTPGTGFRMTTSASFTPLIEDDNNYLLIQGISVSHTGNYGCVRFFEGYGSVAEGVLGTECGKNSPMFHPRRGEFRSCIALNAEDEGFGSTNSFRGAHYYNCVAANCGIGFFAPGGTDSDLQGSSFTNCVAYNNTTNWSIGAGLYVAGTKNNASSDFAGDPPPGTSPYTSDVTSADFVDAANDDFHLAGASALAAAGFNLYSTFTQDIDDEEYPSSGAWPIGADHLAVSVLTITPASAVHSHSADAAALTQASVLAAAAAAHSVSADAAVLNAGNTLTAANALHSHAVDQPALTQISLLVPAGALHAHLADQPALNQGSGLDPDGALHSHVSDVPALSQANILAAAGAVHAQSAEAPSLTASHVLAVVSATHAHLADGATLTIGGALLADSALHGHLADAAAITEAGNISPDDAAHVHTADLAGLSQASTISPSGSGHAQAASQPTLDLSVVVEPADSLHGHLADQATLTQQAMLAVSSAVHAHLSDEIILSQGLTIIASDALHAHFSNNASIALGGAITPNGRIFLIPADCRIFQIN